MNWEKIADRLDLEAQRLDGACFAEKEPQGECTLEDIESALCADEESARPEVDSAARALAAGKPCPPLSPDGAAFLEARLFYAYTLAATFVATGTQPVKTNPKDTAWSEDEEATLIWLLIECWPTLGLGRWLESQLRAYEGRLPEDEGEI
jgi:hypothetical protein